MEQPEYFPVQANEVPTYSSEDKLVTVNVFAGEIAGVKGTIPSKSAVNAATVSLTKEGKIFISLPPEHNAFIYLLDGKVKLGDYGITEAHHAAVFANDGEGITLEAVEDTRLLLMTGAPLNEKVVAHGPFVMNTETQIMEAMRDYQMGKMGVLIED
jgi:redox-sensitive bicupin YhaK (pirin superfamily)